MERKYKWYDERKPTRDGGDLRRNLINSVFEGLKAEGCLADRGDARPIKFNNPPKKIIKRNTKIKPNEDKVDKRKLSDAKAKVHDRGEGIFKERDKIVKVNNVTKTEDPICPIKSIYVNSERREDKIKQVSPKKEKYSDKSDGQVKTYLDMEGRKALRERYTVKLKRSVKNSEAENVQESLKLFDDLNKTEPIQSPTIVNIKKSEHSVEREKKKKELQVQRKPMIKTIRVKDDNRVYKAVTFVDRKPTMPIQIKIPSDIKKAKPEMRNRGTDAVKETAKVVYNKYKKNHRLKGRTASPADAETSKRQCSPPTEVAKWAPSCLNQHTKPYYEAWVDTTLAAINKCSKYDNMYLEKQNIVNTFKRELSHNESLEVVENCTDERYTGKIRVRQR